MFIRTFFFKKSLVQTTPPTNQIADAKRLTDMSYRKLT